MIFLKFRIAKYYKREWNFKGSFTVNISSRNNFSFNHAVLGYFRNQINSSLHFEFEESEAQRR